MKYHSIITSAFTSLCLLTSNSSLATEQVRWFEVEIIFFKQISKASDNTEQFSQINLSPKKRPTFDLLAPYLQPDIASLKQLLPNCEQSATSLPYNITPASLWANNVTNESNDVDRGKDITSLQVDNEGAQNDTSTQVADDKEATSSTNMSVTVLSSGSNETTKEETAAEKSLNKASYQAQYANIELPVYNKYPMSNQTPLCVIPAEFFQQHLSSEQLEHFNIDSFPVEKIASTINGIEQWQDDENGEITWASDSPYLISQDSLRLKSIANRIKRSRNYAPLLHLGWRQIGESNRQAKAMKLYAGDNLELGYQQAIATQASEQKMLEIQAILEQRVKADALSSQISLVGSESLGLAVEHTQEINELSIAEQLRLQAKQQQLNNIFQQFSLLDNQTDTDQTSNISSHVKAANGTIQNEETIQRIVAQLSSEITAKEPQLNLKSTTDKQVDITAPPQPWSIDGLFKVHLDHYLYINTEFNIIDSSDKASVLTTKQKLTNNDNETLNQNKIISFKQDRRVITGEIHYFDHPHIGMIVQIRRFDPNKPADEAVSQSKK